MKRLLAVVLILVTCLCAAACSGGVTKQTEPVETNKEFSHPLMNSFYGEWSCVDQTNKVLPQIYIYENGTCIVDNTGEKQWKHFEHQEENFLEGGIYVDHEQIYSYGLTKENDCLILSLSIPGEGKFCYYPATVLNEKFSKALSLFNAGDYEKALSLFVELGTWNEADGYALKSEKYISYKSAISLFEAGKYSEAYDVFITLSGFEDSVNYAKKSQKHIDYETAKMLFTAKQYLDAYNAFVALQDFEDSANYAKYCNAMNYLSLKDYEQAYLTFVELGKWLDAADYANRFVILKNQRLEKTLYEVNAFGDESLDNVAKYEYDELGRVIFEPVIEYPVPNYSTCIYYYYDDSGKVSKAEHLDGSIYEKLTYFYDENNNLLRIESLSYDGVKSIEIYENGLLQNITRYYSNGVLHYSTNFAYEYDDENRVIKRIPTELNGGVVSPTITYEYDSEGNLIQEILDYGYECLCYSYAYKDGYLVRCEAFDGSGRIYAYCTFTYGNYYSYNEK